MAQGRTNGRTKGPQRSVLRRLAPMIALPPLMTLLGGCNLVDFSRRRTTSTSLVVGGSTFWNYFEVSMD